MNVEKQYIKAFNNGYILAVHEPQLLNTISKSFGSTNNYLKDFMDGKNQFELDNSKNQLFELHLPGKRSLEKEKGFEKENRAKD
jgi:hypothetical protein